jgi:hypothetical protein
MNAGVRIIDIYGWNWFTVQPRPSNPIFIPQFEDFVLPGEYIVFVQPIVYNGITLHCGKIITAGAGVNDLFVQLATDSDRIASVPVIESPLYRPYVFYPNEIVLTNIGVTISISLIKCIAIILSQEEVENTILGSLASVSNVFLLQFQVDITEMVTSNRTLQQSFIPSFINSYTMRIRELIIKIIKIFQSYLNCRASNQRNKVKMKFDMTHHEWKYISDGMSTTIDIVNSNSGIILVRDHATRECIKIRHFKSIIRIDSDEKLNKFKSLLDFGKGLRCRNLASCKNIDEDFILRKEKSEGMSD